MKLVSESQNGIDWFFTMSKLRYRSTDLLGNHTTLHLSLAMPGIGLPEDVYLKFAKMAQKINPKVTCVPSYGEMCFADLSCDDLETSLKGTQFDFAFKNAADRLILPIESLMKESTKKNQCKLLVTNLGKNAHSDAIVLGTAFF